MRLELTASAERVAAGTISVAVVETSRVPDSSARSEAATVKSIERREDGLLHVVLTVSPSKPGARLFRIVVSAASDDGTVVLDAGLHPVLATAAGTHTRVLYLESAPRYDYIYLSNALARDHARFRVHALLTDGDDDTPQPATNVLKWSALTLRDGVPQGGALREYDVIVLGDVAPRTLARHRDDIAEQFVSLRDFVAEGGGLMLIAGAGDNPSSYAGTAVEELLPVVLDRQSELLDPETPLSGFSLRLTPAGLRSPWMQIDVDLDYSRALWEESSAARQFWVFPSLRAHDDATVFATADHALYDNKHGPRPVFASRPYGLGAVMFVGADDLWRLRKGVGDLYFLRFYGRAIEGLADASRHRGENRTLVSMLRPEVALGESVTVRLVPPPFTSPESLELSVFHDETHESTTVRLTADATAPSYSATWVPSREGTYDVLASEFADWQTSFTVRGR